MKTTFLVFLFAISTVASATKYYVSSSGGNDAFEGKSDTTAWKTISKVNGYSFAAGDIISFKCGDTWRETLTVPRSGTSGAYMVFNSYGIGDKPKLYGSKQAITWTTTAYSNIWQSATTLADPYKIHSTEYCEIFFVNLDNSITWSNEKATYTSNFSNLTTNRDWTWNSNTIYIYSTTDPNTTYSSIEVPQSGRVIYIGSYDYITIDNFDIKFTAIGIDSFEQTSGQNRIGLTVSNCKISYIGSQYAITGGEAPGHGYGTQFMRSNQIISNCEISECGRRLISLHLYDGDNITLTNMVFENNYFHDGYHATGISPRFVGGRVNNKIDGLIIRNNLFTEPINKNPDALGQNSNMIYLEVSESGAEIKNVQIYNNILMYCTQVGCIVTGNVNNVEIYNNTFYEHNHHTSANVVHIKSQVLNGLKPTNVSIKNNIFYNSGSRSQNANQHDIYIDNGVPTANFDIDYNLHYETDVSLANVYANSSYYYTNRTGYKKITELPTDFGWQIHTPTNYLESPGFVSATDLHLQVGSPAIGAGIAIPEITTDFEGKTYNNPPSIGAFEYNTGTINNSPAVSLTSPGNGSIYTAPATITIIATATDSDGTISKVEFYNGSTKLGESTGSPYTYTWNSVSTGTYSLTAIATDNLNAKKTSAAVSVTVNTGTTNNPPAVSLTSPGNGSIYTAPATITIIATATDSDGTISKVEFYNGSTKLGESTGSPYTYTWNSVSTGTYSLTAVATDNLNAKKTSAAVSVTVNTGTINKPPAVSLTSPGNGSTFTAPATITITATATDPDGTISKVEFYNGSTKLGESTGSPYTYTWNSVSAGTYSLTTVATDNLNSTTASSAVEVAVEAAFIYDTNSDNLNLYPNPNDGHFSIDLIDPLQNEKGEITISDLAGRSIYKETMLKEETIKQFYLSYIKPGTYILMITRKDIFVAKKFIKK